MTKRGLGKGLDALFQAYDNKESVDASKDQVLEVKIHDIDPNIGQPRKNFDSVSIEELSKSIEEHGIVQPIIVRP